MVSLGCAPSNITFTDRQKTAQQSKPRNLKTPTPIGRVHHSSFPLQKYQKFPTQFCTTDNQKTKQKNIKEKETGNPTLTQLTNPKRNEDYRSGRAPKLENSRSTIAFPPIPQTHLIMILEVIVGNRHIRRPLNHIHQPIRAIAEVAMIHPNIMRRKDINGIAVTLPPTPVMGSVSFSHPPVP